jgi:glycosyltransferase involved in cell wall biosynthesis
MDGHQASAIGAKGMKKNISVVINTLNEEKNLPYALRSVCDWAEEIVIVDMYSEDRTVEIAKQYGAKVFFHERIAAFDGARKFAIERASNEWILVLDADELVPKSLSRIFLEIVAANEVDVVIIPRLNYLLGTKLLHTGWGPQQDKHPRLFRMGKLTTSSIIHDFMKPVNESRILELDYVSGRAIIHFNYVDTVQFVEKMNRYTSIEAQQAHDRGERAIYTKTIFQAMKEFANRYFRESGYRDGWRGFSLSLLMSLYRILIFSKLKEIETYGNSQKVIENYRVEVERILAEYKGIKND